MGNSENGPLKAPNFHILLSLSGGQRHGSAIVRDVLRQTESQLRLWPATLYGALEQMAKEGWIRELADGERPDGASDRRRYYCIADEGARVLASEAQRMAGLAETALERIAVRKLGAT